MAAASDAVAKPVMFNFLHCPFGARAWLTFLFKDVDFEFKVEKKGSKSDEFKAAYKRAIGRNPSSDGTTPTCIFGDDVLTESAIVARYIDMAFPEVSLMPSDAKPMDLARIELMISQVSPMTFFGPYKSSKNEEAKQAAVAKLTAYINNLNAQLLELSAEGYALGDKPSLFEVMAFPFFDRLVAMPLIGVDLASLTKDAPRVANWIQFVRKSEAVQSMYAFTAERVPEETALDHLKEHLRGYFELA